MTSDKPQTEHDKEVIAGRYETEAQWGITPEEFKNIMRACYVGDPEGDHVNADKQMCNLLRLLGYGDAVDVFEEMVKWYA